MAIQGLPRGLPLRVPGGSRLYLRPLGLLPAARAEGWLARGAARLLAGGPFAFTAGELVVRAAGGFARVVAPLAEIVAWAAAAGEGGAAVAARLSLMTAPRALPGSGAAASPLLMGVVNVTPDSFSDGGAFLEPAAALAQAEQLAGEGAAILDIGAESVRPGAESIALDDERRRIGPVLQAVAARRGALGAVTLSIDTRKAAVMRLALDAGAGILNDVSALTDDPHSLALAAESKAWVVLMHGLSDAITVAAEERVLGADPMLDLFDCLEARIAVCEAAGIGRERIIVDPGIGFGKSGAETLMILSQIGLLHGLGCPILLGVSRKGLTAALDRRYGPAERLPGSLAAALAAAGQGVQILRVHDVAATRQALDVWRGIVGAA
jgi:dihydropteroate synthase